MKACGRGTHKVRETQMRKLVFVAVLGLSVHSFNVQDATAGEQVCFDAADFISPQYISGTHECYKDNWLFGGLFDWTAY